MVRNGAGRYAVNAGPGTRAVPYQRVMPRIQYGGFSPCEPGGRLPAPANSPRSRRCRCTTMNGHSVTAEVIHAGISTSAVSSLTPQLTRTLNPADSRSRSPHRFCTYCNDFEAMWDRMCVVTRRRRLSVAAPRKLAVAARQNRLRQAGLSRLSRQQRQGHWQAITSMITALTALWALIFTRPTLTPTRDQIAIAQSQ